MIRVSQIAGTGDMDLQVVFLTLQALVLGFTLGIWHLFWTHLQLQNYRAFTLQVRDEAGWLGSCSSLS